MMSAPAMPSPATELEHLEAAFVRSPSSTWPLPASAEPAPLDVPPSSVSDDDAESYRMTIVRTQRYCCV